MRLNDMQVFRVPGVILGNSSIAHRSIYRLRQTDNYQTRCWLGQLLCVQSDRTIVLHPKDLRITRTMTSH